MKFIIPLNILTVRSNSMLRLKQIAVTEENYLILKSFGKAGDSFNDVISGILKTLKKQQTDSGVGRSHQSVAATTHQEDGIWT